MTPATSAQPPRAAASSREMSSHDTLFARLDARADGGA